MKKGEKNVGYFRIYKRHKFISSLTPEEERDISVKAKAGDKDAQEKLVTSNLRLVISIARKYTNMGIPILDLIQEGNMGLIKAVEKYEPDKNIRFSTYSTFWIKQSILRYITSSRGLIRFPSYVYDGISRMKNIFRITKTDIHMFHHLMRYAKSGYEKKKQKDILRY